MDSSILQLFTVEEILGRIGSQRLTGCFHVFAPKESANLFFKGGAIVAAIKGKAEGAEIVHQILTWKAARYFWEPNAALSAPALVPLQMDVATLLGKSQPAAAPEPSRPPTRPTPIPIGAKGLATGPLSADTPASSIKSAPIDITATKTFSPSAEVRGALEDALVAKHHLALNSIDGPEMYVKLTRVSSLLGRNAACDIPVAHPSISRQHALLQITDRGLHVKDLDTTNGTKVNGIVLREGYVNVGDRLTFGHLTFKLERTN